jgi:hypothetical protein
MDKLVPLNFCIGSLVTEKQIDLIMIEAYSFPPGRDRQAFFAYAESLKRKLEEQNRLKV